jgi:hypothetical protein
VAIQVTLLANRSIGQDQVLLEDLRKYALRLFGSATIINLTPSLLKPVVGRLVQFDVFKRANKCLKRCLQTVSERLKDNKQKREDSNYDWTPPVSFLLF